MESQNEIRESIALMVRILAGQGTESVRAEIKAIIAELTAQLED